MNDFLNKEKLKKTLQRIEENIEDASTITMAGTIMKITGMKLEASGLAAPIGTICKIKISPHRYINAEVVGFSDDITYLMAIGDMQGIKQGTRVYPSNKVQEARVGMALLGRIIDAAGNPIDGKGPIDAEGYYSLFAEAVNPLQRQRISQPLDVGIRCINALLTVGKGQRLGIFAGSGIGKSVLLGMMTRFTQAEVVVVGLIGERSREVKEFIEESLGAEGLAKSVVVAAPADTSPLMRVNGAAMASSIAEYYRDKGMDVLLIVDSLTRYAQAQREISLSVGELPATKGFTPSVFAKLAQLVERSGNGPEGKGSITAFYTVLVEGDDHTEPVADHSRSLLDGHIFLSRHLADAGHYPAIDIERSISRVMTAVIDAEHQSLANTFKKLYSSYVKNKDLVNIGMYQHGADKTLDEAIKRFGEMEKFLRQGTNECADMQTSLAQLKAVLGVG